MKLEKPNPFEVENLARLFKDDLARYVAIKRQASDQWRDYKYRVAGTADSSTDRAYRQEYARMQEKADQILDDIQSRINKEVDMRLVVNAYRKLTKKGGIDDKPIPLPKKQIINTYSPRLSDDIYRERLTVGSNFILYPEQERYEVVEKSQHEVICTNLDTDETETFSRADIIDKFRNDELTFI